MEIDVRQRRTQRNRRRERAQRMQAARDKDVVDGGVAATGELDDSADDDTANPPVREKPPQRRKKQKDNSPLLEEDIIDGFAILAFKTYEDLEVSFFPFLSQFLLKSIKYTCGLNKIEDCEQKKPEMTASILRKYYCNFLVAQIIIIITTNETKMKTIEL